MILARMRSLPPSRLMWRVIAIGCLVLVLFIGLEIRTTGLFPAERALVHPFNYDEGVYLGGSQAMLSGQYPYRDFFFPHPPLSLAIFAFPAMFHGADALAIGRYVTIFFGITTLVLVFGVTRKLGGSLAALVAVGLVACDARVIDIDRTLVLESIVNSFSLLAILVYLIALERHGNRTGLMLLTGVLAGLAGMTKILGLITLAAILFHLLGQLGAGYIARRLGSARKFRLGANITWQDLGLVIAGTLGITLLVTGPFLIASPTPFIRQVFIFQVLRPPDGTTDLGKRWVEIFASEESLATILGGAIGFGMIILKTIMTRQAGRWSLIMLWASGIIAVFFFSKTFYRHYYVQLAVPLAILAGACGNSEFVRSLFTSSTRDLRRAVLMGIQIGLVVYALLNYELVQHEYVLARQLAEKPSVVLHQVNDFLIKHTSPQAKILAFEPIHVIVASRQLAGLTSNTSLVDNYGYLLYVGLGLEKDGFPGKTSNDALQVFHRPESQARIIQIAAQADCVITDYRSAFELIDSSFSAITAGRKKIYDADDVQIYAGPHCQ